MDKRVLNLLFVHEQENLDWWQDGLARAIKDLKEFNIVYLNPHKETDDNTYDFVFGIGSWSSKVAEYLNSRKERKGLYVAGCIAPIPEWASNFNVVWYESDWVINNYMGDFRRYNPDIKFIKCFGVNTEVYRDMSLRREIDFLGVGALATWKRWQNFYNKSGIRLIIGEYQAKNEAESLDITRGLLTHGIGVMPIISAEGLNYFYNLSKNVYIPASIYGGGERAVLEARVAGCNVIVEPDNLKLREYINWDPIPTFKWCADQLRRGINEG